MSHVIRIGICLPKDLVRQIDDNRGDVSRSRYLRRVLERGLEKPIANSKANAR